MSLALRIQEIEDDSSLIGNATKECFDCDPDNPISVPRPTCKSCGGSGRQGLAANDVASELKLVRGKAEEHGDGQGDDLYLDY